MTTKDAIDHLIGALKEDSGYFYTWQANIAVMFQDEYQSWIDSHGKKPDREAVHQISNNAAIRFLNHLCK